MVLENPLIVSVFVAGLIAQLIKVIRKSILNKTLSLEAFINMGGMPSCHSAFVSALAIATGISEGFNSTIFIIVLVFALVIMYDAAGIRRSAGNQGKLLNRLTKLHKLKSNKLKEELGHSPLEVIVGALIGVVSAVYFSIYII